MQIYRKNLRFLYWKIFLTLAKSTFCLMLEPFAMPLVPLGQFEHVGTTFCNANIKQRKSFSKFQPWKLPAEIAIDIYLRQSGEKVARCMHSAQQNENCEQIQAEVGKRLTQANCKTVGCKSIKWIITKSYRMVTKPWKKSIRRNFTKTRRPAAKPSAKNPQTCSKKTRRPAAKNPQTCNKTFSKIRRPAAKPPVKNSQTCSKTANTSIKTSEQSALAI